MKPEEVVALYQGLSMFLYGCIVVVAVALLTGPSEKACSPDCNHCPAWRREQEAKAKAESIYARCPVCMKRHKPSDPHQ